MNIELPTTPGYAGAFLRGLRSAGDTPATEEAGGVVLRRIFSINGGILVPAVGVSDTIAFADSVVLASGAPWVSYESEAALAKRHGDLIVMGGRDATRGGWVLLDTTEWLRRDATSGGSDDDLARNLFGWHPRAEVSRRDDARTLKLDPHTPASPQPGDRFDRFQNAQRRLGLGVSTSREATLPTQATVQIVHERKAPETADPVMLTVSYHFFAPHVTLYLHHGTGPDRKPRWCPHDQGAMLFDTLVLKPDAMQAIALWRLSWRWGDPGADALRRIVVTEGAA